MQIILPKTTANLVLKGRPISPPPQNVREHGARGFQRDAEEVERGALLRLLRGHLGVGRQNHAEQCSALRLVIGGRDREAGAVSVRLHHGGPQGTKPKAEVVTDILVSIKERRG